MSLADDPPTMAGARVADTDVFKHSTPKLYDRYMVPLLFEPYARVVAERVARLDPRRVLETAAGTGVLTALVRQALPHAEIVATDISPAMVQFRRSSPTRTSHSSRRTQAPCISMTKRLTWCCASSA